MVYFQQSLFGRTSWERFFQMTGWTLELCSQRSQPPTFQCLLLEDGQEPEWCEGIRPISHKLLRECYQADASRNKATIAAVQGKISRATGRMENLIAMRADGEISKEQFQTLRQKAETELAALNEELSRLNSAFDDETDALDMAAIEAALDSMLDFSGPSIDSNIIEKFVCRITPVNNGHYRWDLNFAPNKKQAIIGAIEGRKGKASVEIKEYGEDDEHPHRTYDRSIQFSTDGTIAYFCLIAACAAARRAIGTRNGEQDT